MTLLYHAEHGFTDAVGAEAERLSALGWTDGKAAHAKLMAAKNAPPIRDEEQSPSPATPQPEDGGAPKRKPGRPKKS